MIRSTLVAVCLLSTALLCTQVFAGNLAQDISDDDCLDCHGVTGYAVPTGKTGDSPKRRLDLNVSAMRASVHGKLPCLDCHNDIKESPHKREPLKAVDCISCHEKLAPESKTKQNRVSRRKAKTKVVINNESFARSVHSKQKKDKANADCATCHTAHYVYLSSDPRALSFRENSPKVCGSCHPKALRNYKKSIHGAALLRPWKGDSATCSDCHSSHTISISKELSTHRIITENCGHCHLTEVNSYMSTTHGQLAWLGNKEVPRCIDCHRGHDTQKISNTLSMVSNTNILKTCRECHE
ncbi:MAG: cytochrome c3 family protein, partial [Thiohalomonadales bacterium]